MQTDVIPKILSLNKNFNFEDKTNRFNTSILYNSQQRNSKKVFDDFKAILGKTSIKIREQHANLHPFDILVEQDLRNFLKQNEIIVLYLTPVRGVDISAITKICKEEQVLTITAVEEFQDNDVSVILGLEENKLQIKINLQSAKREGAEFSSRLLKIARIIE